MDILNQINTSNDLLFVLLRTLITYLYAILLFRWEGGRFRINTPFDFIVVIMIGAILGRTIYGGASLINTMAASFLIILLHKIFAHLAFTNKHIGFIVKGKPITLVQNGKFNWKEMKSKNISKEDILELYRKDLKNEEVSKIKKAILERNGEISFLV